MSKKPVLQAVNISKQFPGVKALTNVSMDYYSGEVHAICGENGAGKSTLIKILSGVYQPTSGKIIFNGDEKHIKDPGTAIHMGISVIHQELSVAGDLTVAENIFLGVEPKRKGFLDRKKMNNDARAILEKMHVNVKETEVVKNLSAAQQQMVEIAKAISKQSRVVIMDEPTSSLSEGEIHSLFNIIEMLKEDNVAIVYITHRLKELFVIAERVTLLRDGCFVKTMMIKDTNESEIVSNMVGREIKDYYNKQEHTAKDEILSVKNLTRDGVFYDVSFKAYRGEILGIAGLVGAKRTEVLECLFAAEKYSLGEVILNGRKVRFKTPMDAINNKIGFVTEDRRISGLMLGAKISENIALASLINNCRKGGILDFKWEKKVSTEHMDKLKIKAPDIYTEVNTLSGGNQQKVVLAKWLVAHCELLLLDEPTRGIDVNAKSEFYGLMNAFVQQGGSIIMVSSEMPEVIGVCDRIVVMCEGRVKGELEREELSEQSIIQLASIHS